MHLLFVGPFPWPSAQGSQAYLASQVRALVAQGHRVTLVVYGGGQGGEIPGARLVRSSPAARFSGGGMHWSRPLADLGLIRALRRLHREDPVDLVHAHQIEGPLVAKLAGLGVPIVYDLHTAMAEELGAHLPQLGPLAGPLGRLADRLALRCADAGCAISDRAASLFAEAGLPHRHIGPAVDPTELVATSDPTPRLVYTGNLDAYQDLDLLYATLPLPVPLWVVTGSDGPVPDGVHVIRDPRPAAAIQALAGATCAVIPRTTVAGFPIKLLNQLGMGVPTVVMASSGLDVPGIVRSSPGTLGTDLATLLADQPRRAALGAAGRAWVLQHCTPTRRAEALEQLYFSVLTWMDRPAFSA